MMARARARDNGRLTDYRVERLIWTFSIPSAAKNAMTFYCDVCFIVVCFIFFCRQLFFGSQKRLMEKIPRLKKTPEKTACVRLLERRKFLVDYNGRRV